MKVMRGSIYGKMYGYIYPKFYPKFYPKLYGEIYGKFYGNRTTHLGGEFWGAENSASGPVKYSERAEISSGRVRRGSRRF